MAPSGVKINRWRRNRGSAEGHLGKIAVRLPLGTRREQR